MLEGSLDAGLGAGVKGSIPLISGEAEVFFGNSAVFDAFGESRVEMAARALIRKRSANPVFRDTGVTAMLLAEEEHARWAGSDRQS